MSAAALSEIDITRAGVNQFRKMPIEHWIFGARPEVYRGTGIEYPESTRLPYPLLTGMPFADVRQDISKAAGASTTTP
jgi:hypothetical protein